MINLKSLENLKRETYFVQFLHPGGEHLTAHEGKTENKVAKGKDYHDWSKKEALENGIMPSNKGPHRRKFMKNIGRYIDKNNSLSDEVDIMFWGEYECPSEFKEIDYNRKVNYGKEKLPRYIHHTFMMDNSDKPRVNTDPYIFGDSFYYSVCRQSIDKNPNKLYKLDRKSIILFGSSVGNKFILDTLFVVKDYMPYDKRNIEILKEKLELSDRYHNAGLEPLKKHNSDCTDNNSGCTDKGNYHIFYTGATYEDPIEINGQKIYSFFPCKQYEENDGFARPIISFEKYKDFIDTIPDFKFSGKKTDGYSIIPANDEQILKLWNIVREQVLDQGCYLGVWAKE